MNLSPQDTEVRIVLLCYGRGLVLAAFFCCHYSLSVLGAGLEPDLWMMRQVSNRCVSDAGLMIVAFFLLLFSYAGAWSRTEILNLGMLRQVFNNCATAPGLMLVTFSLPLRGA